MINFYLYSYISLHFQLGIKLIWGRYKGGVLEGAGKVQLMDETETVLHGNFVKGKLHGNVRGLTFKEGQLTFIGKFKNGRPSGKCWKCKICLKMYPSH